MKNMGQRCYKICFNPHKIYQHFVKNTCQHSRKNTCQHFKKIFVNIVVTKCVNHVNNICRHFGKIYVNIPLKIHFNIYVKTHDNNCKKDIKIHGPTSSITSARNEVAAALVWFQKFPYDVHSKSLFRRLYLDTSGLVSGLQLLVRLRLRRDNRNWVSALISIRIILTGSVSLLPPILTDPWHWQWQMIALELVHVDGCMVASTHFPY